jgi:ABC-type transport system involved in cytochrome c biogenesis permease subunit
VTVLLQIASALYLAAGIAGAVALAGGAARAGRAALALLALGLAAHSASFVAMHEMEPVPPLTELPQAVSLMCWMAVAAFLVFARRGRLAGLTLLLGPLAFLGTFFAALRAPGSVMAEAASGRWPHAHVVLASAGLAMLAVAAVAGGFYLLENRRLKRKRVQPGPGVLPSLEALDRVNAVSLAVGFPLLTLGVLTGMLWGEGVYGAAWSGTPHEAWNALAWLIYAVLVGARFGAHQGARDAAASAVAGFAFLLFAVVGVGMLA